MADVLGVIGDSLGIYSFIAAIFASHETNVAKIRVSANLNGYQGTTGADGNIDSIRLYNQDQQLIGNKGGGYVGSGGFLDIAVSQPNSQQATYVEVAASNNAVCIPYVTATFVDGSQYGWAGDWGWECGLEWYPGALYIDNGNHQPRCVWIDNDHTSFQAGLLEIHMPSFHQSQVTDTNAHDYCGYPAFRAYKSNAGGNTGIFKRDVIQDAPEENAHKMKRAVDPRLVISSSRNHNATEVCESKTSRGPDFISLHENVYCNMETRMTLPLCADGIVAHCFDLDSNSEQNQDTRTQTSPKQFAEVIKWN